MCMHSIKTHSHLFFQRHVAWSSINYLFNTFEESWVHSQWSEEMLLTKFRYLEGTRMLRYHGHAEFQVYMLHGLK